MVKIMFPKLTHCNESTDKFFFIFPRTEEILYRLKKHTKERPNRHLPSPPPKELLAHGALVPLGQNDLQVLPPRDRQPVRCPHVVNLVDDGAEDGAE